MSETEFSKAERLSREIYALKESIEDRDNMHDEHIQTIEARRLRLEIALSEAIRVLEYLNQNLVVRKIEEILSGKR